jgi:hypothetical protein
MRKLFVPLIIIISSVGLIGVNLNSLQTIKIKVIANSLPVPSARTRIQASDNSALTDQYGGSVIFSPENFDNLVITAWAEGYFNGYNTLYPGDTLITIELHGLYKNDNPEYAWISPVKDSTSPNNCGNCHAEVLMNQWGGNAHAHSATNPFFLAIYYGKDTTLSADCGAGYKKDFPGRSGNCATCHIPGAAVHDPWGVDPLSVSEVNKNGVFCDVCHKIYGVTPASGQGTTGVLSIDFLRPPEGKQMFFGPFDDIHEPDAYLPLIRKSEFCAACHTVKFRDVELYNSFNEWRNSPYPAMDIQCQTCHMAPDGITTNFAPGKGGLERNPVSIPSHLQPGSRDIEILRNALIMTLKAEQIADSIKVMVSLFNDRTGHHVPTGQPSRNMILLVECTDDKGNELKFLEGERVPWWGGTGGVSEGNYSGLPGKGFAKVLEDYNGNAPSPSWRPSRIQSDNRIAAFDTDSSLYFFKAPRQSTLVKIKAMLLYRRFFKQTVDEKLFDIDDIMMEYDSVQLCTKTEPVNTEIF